MPNVPKDVAASAQAISGVGVLTDGQKNERELVRLAQNGTEAAFEELVRRHQQRVFAVVARILHRREDVEEIAQQVFLKAFVSIRRFDMRSAFSTWLYKIAVNECWDSLRKKKVRPLVYEADLSEDQVQRLDSYATAGRNPADEYSRNQGRREKHSASHAYKRGPTQAHLEPPYRNRHHKDAKRGEAPSRDAEPAGNHCHEQANRQGDAL